MSAIDEAIAAGAIAYNDSEGNLEHALCQALTHYTRAPAGEQPEQVAQCPIKEAQDALVNLKPELQRSKLDEWKACYAALFNTLNPVVMENKRLKDQLARDGREVERLQSIIERDRSLVADGITGIKKAIASHEWLRLGRGSYEYNDDRWKDEFGQCLDAISTALGPLKRVASDLTDSPTDSEKIRTARATLPTAADASDDRALQATIKDIITEWTPGENLHETTIAVIDAVRSFNTAAGADKAEVAMKKMVAALQEAHHYLDGRIDIVDGNEGPEPNEAMTLALEIDEAIQAYNALRAQQAGADKEDGGAK